MDEFNAVNAVQEGNVDPQTEDTVQDAGESEPERSPEAAGQESAQTPEQNALAARIRRSAETAARDELVREIFGGKGLRTYADYRKMKDERKMDEQAAALNMDPGFYRHYVSLRNEAETARREHALLSQDMELSADPVKGGLYKSWQPQVKDMADRLQCDYNTAFLLILEKNLGNVISSSESQAEQTAVRRLLANGQSSPGPLGASPSAGPTAVSNMTKAEFERLQDAVLRGEIKSL